MTIDLFFEGRKVIRIRKDRRRKRVPECGGRWEEAVAAPTNPRATDLHTVPSGGWGACMRAVARAQASDVMCSEVRTTSSTHSPRPKIELVRVSSSERAKIPINPVQLNLTYCHVR
ncbi:hypothetical protein SK128_003640 [Halocaridina rubra]|uniref:Uncharacterized protein n=1 Tax=Halocaridina rubra TaxID=373956 RepID=A0AAN9A994_HALRR